MPGDGQLTDGEGGSLQLDDVATVLPDLERETGRAVWTEESVPPEKLLSSADISEGASADGLAVQWLLSGDRGVTETRATARLGIPVDLEQDLVPSL